MVAHECQNFLNFFDISPLFIIYFFVPFYILLIILVLFFRISLSQNFHKKNLIKTKYFLLEKTHHDP